MLPHHQAQPQNSPAPFSLNVSDSENSFMGNATERVVLNVEVDPNQHFKGILLQVRQVGGNQPMGSFVISGDTNIKYLDCGEGSKNAITHSNGDPKTTIEVEWEPDDDFEGEVQFVATILQDYSTFWSSVKSEQFRVTGSAPGLSSLSSLVVLVLGLLTLLQ